MSPYQIVIVHITFLADTMISGPSQVLGTFQFYTLENTDSNVKLFRTKLTIYAPILPYLPMLYIYIHPIYQIKSHDMPYQVQPTLCYCDQVR